MKNAAISLTSSSLTEDSSIAKIGRRVEKMRKLKRLTQEECARKSGISRASLVKLESGIGDPKISTLIAVSSALSLPLPMLVYGLQPELAGLDEIRSAFDGAEFQRRAEVSTTEQVGASAAGVMSATAGTATTSGIGAVIGGGMAAGPLILGAAPVSAIAAIGYGLFKLFED